MRLSFVVPQVFAGSDWGLSRGAYAFPLPAGPITPVDLSAFEVQ